MGWGGGGREEEIVIGRGCAGKRKMETGMDKKEGRRKRGRVGRGWRGRLVEKRAGRREGWEESRNG